MQPKNRKILESGSVPRDFGLCLNSFSFRSAKIIAKRCCHTYRKVKDAVFGAVLQEMTCIIEAINSTHFLGILHPCWYVNRQQRRKR